MKQNKWYLTFVSFFLFLNCVFVHLGQTLFDDSREMLKLVVEIRILIHARERQRCRENV